MTRRRIEWSPDRATSVWLGFASGAATVTAAIFALAGYATGVLAFGLVACVTMLATEPMHIDLTRDDDGPDDDTPTGVT